MDWPAWRDEFPTFRRKTYLNTCSLAPLSNRVRAAQERFLDEWEDLGAAAWYEMWMDALDALRRKVARVLHAAPEEIAVAPSVSVALSAVASSLDYGSRPRVVLSEMDFPTLAYQWAVKPGVDQVWVSSEDRVSVPPERFEAAADRLTSVLATSHVYYTSGAIQDIARIGRAARRVGALSVIDAYQATGQVPTDVHEAGIDVLVTGGLKWLLGGTGIAFLYVRRGLIPSLRPTIAGWFGNARMFSFDPKAFAFHDSARRFELGTTANAAVYAASAGLDIVLEIGVERIRDRTTELVTDLVDRLEEARFDVRTPREPGQRAGIVMVAAKEPAKVVEFLGKRGTIVDYRHDRVRISPYFYNTPEDNAFVVEALEAERSRR